MDVRRAMPHQALRSIVRSFEERRAVLGAQVLAFPLTARPHQIIDIYLEDCLRVRADGGQLETAPEAVVVGPQGSRRIHIYASGQVHIFNILLQPAALHRLVGIDMTSLTNEGVAARDVLGRYAPLLNDAVRSAQDFASRIAAAENWFGMMLERSAPDDRIGEASRTLLTARGNLRIDTLVKQSGLSPRQFQRRFTTQVGLSPKLYARTTRFDHALTAHRNQPATPWTNIIHDAGYYDQAHFVRECHALVGVPPSQFIGDWDNIFFLHG
ncbi:MAG TPA: helix-turn-helix domain-containing protein [Bradyrhizobium sp.]|jgi:AraC-like DNA-binding protein|uniref:helix-turn-helix domain-containing protein n=1 Tax=Bradyrhizobium sp. TaxID=376 RepID=UPI002B45F433|nr:helix-turn-helix domain-containing protein [Bradyrhizobium sp.]HKO69525.1 helix-turn-helix domain-containing protein [Bradyrhizobium sp.]